MPGQEDLKKDILDQDLCSSCGMCVGLCPYIKTARDRVRVIYPCGLAEGTCYSICPKTGVDVGAMDRVVFGREREDQALGVMQGLYIARAVQDRAAGAQYGGVTSALAALALEEGLVSAMALTGGDIFNPYPVLARNAEEARACAGSKYTGVPTLEILNRAIREGLDQPGIVGRPCQVLAVRKAAQGRLPGAQFNQVGSFGLVLGLFCFWSLDSEFYHFLEQKVKEKIIKMDIPVAGPVIETASGTYRWQVEDLRPYIKKPCNLCLDSTSEWADIAVGSTEYDPAWNTVVVRSDKGRELLDLALRKNVLEVGEYPAERLPLLRRAVLNKKMRVLHMPEYKPGQPGCPVVPPEYKKLMEEQWGGIDQ
ncbi:coenzyme F420 hydrogenase subunit beta [Desulfotomaculum arcticum]|uniref:Coenzyme F420 hydrogenase subunit beta n=1 Tax=Desulfotruncus arcticus DSM 17038 TaxID=1121424 RepID=A0A1I2XQ10_9FIRM|nr:Coenzyme F420 hydrogenase/dehydrogenase, beta subunit C-terminal domain [Desulfotruncus arcticus]SFH15584.1 coenzyme F420 hydrogenase subunit beta [Desulfotomaculum arcticum] [Desulfotruncus arcticus DSM 17038]